MTSGAALASAAALLGVRLDAELLLGHVLDLSRAALIAHDDRILTPEELGDFERLVARRGAGEPLAYLTGTREFWSLTLEVTPAVLIPRPETELLVEWGLERLKDRAAPEILDLGTGSGAIALALAAERRQANVLATDASPAALEVARRNARRNGIANVRFVEGAWFGALAGDTRRRGGFDLIVSNPPYIAPGDPHLPALRHEPPSALVAGGQGLDDLRAIVREARLHLAPRGWLLVEHGAEQGAAVRDLFGAAGFLEIATRRDLAGHPRATGGRHA